MDSGNIWAYLYAAYWNLALENGTGQISFPHLCIPMLKVLFCASGIQSPEFTVSLIRRRIKIQWWLLVQSQWYPCSQHCGIQSVCLHLKIKMTLECWTFLLFLVSCSTCCCPSRCRGHLGVAVHCRNPAGNYLLLMGVSPSPLLGQSCWCLCSSPKDW